MINELNANFPTDQDNPRNMLTLETQTTACTHWTHVSI